MTRTPTFGELERVDLRIGWNNEAQDFTPWLAENIGLLSRTIGIDLELEAQEQAVGPFSADLLCKNTDNDEWVVIENQLEKTDHKHLGQLLTYSAGLGATTVVWVARQFTEEHRAAVDWLNEISGERFNFFALEIELWRIGDSPVAPKLNIVAKPNEWSTSVSGAAATIEAGALSEAKRAQLDFWLAFRTHLQETSGQLKSYSTPKPRSYFRVPFGISGSYLRAVVSTWDEESESYEGGELRAELVLSSKNAKEKFEALQMEAEEIEREFGGALTWYNPNNARRCRIYARQSADVVNRDAWTPYRTWFVENLEALARVFVPRLRRMAS